MANRQANPSNWDQYERGGSPGRTGSLSSNDARHISFEGNSHLGSSPRGDGGEGLNIRRRRYATRRAGNMCSTNHSTFCPFRSSVTNRLAALGDVGGVNSIRSFTRSWQRAAGFTEVIPQRPSFILAPDQEPIGTHDGIPYGRQPVNDDGGESGTSGPRMSLLRQHLEASSQGSEHAIRDDSPEPSRASETQPLLHRPGREASVSSFRDREHKALDSELQLRRTFSVSSSGTPGSIFAGPPQLDILGGSYGSYRSYGTSLPADQEEEDFGRTDSMAQAGEMWRQQQRSGNAPDGETEPILVKEVEQEDGKIVLTVKGQSTLPQTIFNSIK